MQIFSINDMLQSFIPAYLHTISLLKDAIIGAIFANLDEGIEKLFAGDWAWLVIIMGSLLMLWRLKSWVLGFFYHKISR